MEIAGRDGGLTLRCCLVFSELRGETRSCQTVRPWLDITIVSDEEEIKNRDWRFQDQCYSERKPSTRRKLV